MVKKANLVGRPVDPGDCGDLGIHIDRTGRWFYHGSSIDRKEMVCLFAQMMSRDADGRYWLISPGEKGTITVEDVPFLAVELFTGGSGREQVVSFRTNVDDLVTVDQDHPIYFADCPQTGEVVPYVTVRDGLDARLTRPVYYELVALGFEERFDDEELYGLWSSGTFFPLGRLTDPD
ncbi:DUF1285 domain-containing protein [Magnetospirillum moscoviense]